MWQDSIEILIPEEINYEECDLKLVLYDAVGGEGEKVVEDDDSISTAGKKKKKKSKKRLRKEAEKKAMRQQQILEKRGGSLGAKLFGAMGLGKDFPLEEMGIRRELGSYVIRGREEMTSFGQLEKLSQFRWLEFRRKWGNPDDTVIAGSLQVTANFTPPVRSVELDSENESTQDVLTKNSTRSYHGESSVAGSSLSGTYIPEESEGESDDDRLEVNKVQTDSEEDEDDLYDSIMLTIHGAKGLARVDVMSLTDPYAVATFNGEEVGRSTVKENTLNPRFEHQHIIFRVPAGAGATNDKGEDSVLQIEMFDKNKLSADTFLGCATISGMALQNLLGFLAEKEQDSIATVNVKGNDVTIERGPVTWVALAKSPHRTIKENKLAKGQVSVQAAYISGVVREGEGPLAPEPAQMVSIYLAGARELAKVPSRWQWEA